MTVSEPKSAVSEAYRTLRTSLLFAAAQRGVKTLLIASATAGEGKSTTASNLAVVLANADKRVIVVSADLRKPRLHKFFNVPNRKGLVNILAGEAPPWEVLLDPGVNNLRILPSGPVPAQPAELLGSESMGEILAELGSVADFVIVDTAPILVVSDALALAPLCDGVLFIANAETTSRSAVQHARDQLDQIGAPIIGAVLNGFDPNRSRQAYYYRYAYRYRYGAGEANSYFDPREPKEEGSRPSQASL